MGERFQTSAGFVVGLLIALAIEGRTRRHADREQQALERAALLAIVLSAGCALVGGLVAEPELVAGLAAATAGGVSVALVSVVRIAFGASRPFGARGDGAGVARDGTPGDDGDRDEAS